MAGNTTPPLPGLNDPEGERVPTHLPPVVDAHVHLFPDQLFAAIRSWFGAYGWPIRYTLNAREAVAFLLSRGISGIVAMPYAHKPGIARGLNDFIAAIAREEPRVTGLATVFPGEEGMEAILRDAFASGLRGVKLHCHVQCFAPDAAEMHAVFAACAGAARPVLMHAGREPSSPHYKCDPHRLCSAEKVERVLEDHPDLRLVVPHLGADEFDAYERLLQRHDNLWLDTTMLGADYFDIPFPQRLLRARPERVLYGTDFPNIPYAWDRELKTLTSMGLGEEETALLLGENARLLYGPSPR